MATAGRRDQRANHCTGTDAGPRRSERVRLARERVARPVQPDDAPTVVAHELEQLAPLAARDRRGTGRRRLRSNTAGARAGAPRRPHSSRPSRHRNSNCAPSDHHGPSTSSSSAGTGSPGATPRARAAPPRGPRPAGRRRRCRSGSRRRVRHDRGHGSGLRSQQTFERNPACPPEWPAKTCRRGGTASARAPSRASSARGRPSSGSGASRPPSPGSARRRRDAEERAPAAEVGDGAPEPPGGGRAAEDRLQLRPVRVGLRRSNRTTPARAAPSSCARARPARAAAPRRSARRACPAPARRPRRAARTEIRVVPLVALGQHLLDVGEPLHHLGRARQPALALPVRARVLALDPGGVREQPAQRRRSRRPGHVRSTRSSRSSAPRRAAGARRRR